jgi:long-chain acyl-CoA synthetase
VIAAQNLPAAEAKARHLIDMLHERARLNEGKRAAQYKTAEGWKDITWGELHTRVRNAACGLLARGVKPGDRLAVFGSTRLEWCIADLAIIATGGITVPIYASNTTEECQYILENSGARGIFIDNDQGEKGAPGRLTRILKAKASLPALQDIFTFDAMESAEPLHVLAKLEAEGAAFHATNPRAYSTSVDGIAPDSPACFIYTSGTTGNPKGVVLTHKSWVYESECVRSVGLMLPDEKVLLFLPMAHSFGKVIQASWLGLGYVCAFCDNVDNLSAYLMETRPTVLPAVPRVFEKIYSGVMSKALATPGLKGMIAAWALKEFDAYAAARKKGEEYSSLGLAIGKKLVFKNIAKTLRERMGGNIRLCVSGSAPLASKIAYFFELNDLLILEGYGLTETAAGATVNRPDKNKIGTVGSPFPGCELKLAADGEILIKGPNVMKEYFNNPEATKEAFDAEGYFKSGDIGELDADGYLKITDRKKDLIKTSGGKYIAPQNLENALKTTQIISQVMIHGDRRKYVSALVTLNEDVAKKVLAGKGVSGISYVEMTQRPEVLAEIQAAFDALNQTLPSYETVKKFRVLEHDLTLESGDLTPTLKVKRKVVTTKYMKVLDSMYDEPMD